MTNIDHQMIDPSKTFGMGISPYPKKKWVIQGKGIRLEYDNKWEVDSMLESVHFPDKHLPCVAFEQNGDIYRVRNKMVGTGGYRD